MFFILSKTVGLLINPLVILLLLLLPALFLKRQTPKRIFLGLFGFFFLVFTNPVITNEVMQWWEVPAVPFRHLKQPYDAAIVLSGVTAANKAPYDRVHLHKGADRIMHAIQLYKLGKVRKLVLSGGSGLLTADSVSEADRMRTVMLLSGVPAGDILLEPRSRNTHENARFSRQLLEARITDGQYLLVTSAFHMPRALLCFAEEGLPVRAFSTDFYSMDGPYTLEHYLIPSAEALHAWGKLLREWLGLLTYKVMGYA